MKFDTKTAADYAAKKLDSLFERAARDTVEVIEDGNIPKAVTYFAELRDTVRMLAEKMSALQKHVDGLSYEMLPTMLGNQDVRTIIVEGVGRVTVNDRWSASMLDKAKAFEWVRSTGNAGLIIETINAQTLGAFAKEETIAGRPLPNEIFKVSSTPYVSITRS